MTEEEGRAAIVAEVKTWLHTPFRHQARIKGPKGGVDCGQIIAACYENVGLVEKIAVGPYQFQHHMHSSHEDYVDQLLSYTREIAAAEAKPADMVLYKCGRTFSHGGILIEPWPGLIMHSINGTGVEYAHGIKCGFLKGRETRFFSFWGK